MNATKINRLTLLPLTLLLSLLFIVTVPAFANEATHEVGGRSLQVPTFKGWLAGLKAEARVKGVSDATLDAAFKGVQPIKKVVKLDRNQPEFKLTFAQYLKRVAPPFRVNRGKKLLKKHKKLLTSIQAKYGVQPRFIVALWGMETDFGRLTGGFRVINALSTLAFDGRRSRFFRAQLISALQIIEAGHISADAMQGSWAGAMGQTQFMPSTFLKHAVDFDGDGRINVWTDSGDALASGAHYLSNTGWKGDETWGREVTLPADFPKDMLELDVAKPISLWQEMGVRRANGKDLPARDILASVVQLDDKTGPAYMVYDNYRAIMDWNKSKNFATAVGILSDRIGGRK